MPTALRLKLAPQRRFEAIDVNRRIVAESGDILHRHRRALYCSFHTTAGYLDQSLSARMHHRPDLLSQFFRAFHVLFPQGGEYHHDRMELRSELTDEQKIVEPRNADSHLTYIGSGMRNCVTYRARPDAPVYFIGGGRADPKPRTGFELAVVQLALDEFGVGLGSMAAAARVKPDGEGGVVLEDYAEKPIRLTLVRRQSQ